MDSSPSPGCSPSATLLLTTGYPAISALLCAAGVSAPRRGAAAWLLLTFGSLAVVMTSGALVVGRPSPVLDVLATTAYLAMLAAATQALSVDPGPRARADQPTAAVPLAGVVVGYCQGPGARFGHDGPYSGTGWLTSPADEAHSVHVPRARLYVTSCLRSLVVA